MESKDASTSVKSPSRARFIGPLAGCLFLAIVVGYLYARSSSASANPSVPKINYVAREFSDVSGYAIINQVVKDWPGTASLQEIGEIWNKIGFRNIEHINDYLAAPGLTPMKRFMALQTRALCYNYEGEPRKGYESLKEARAIAEENPEIAAKHLYSIIYTQGVTALRCGENENCIDCRGECSCILPIAASAVHVNREGSELAIGHFREYLSRFPDDPEVRWLLNLAYMTLGDYPEKVEPKYLVRVDKFFQSEMDIGKFRDIGHLVGLNRLNMAGGAIMEDFDNDGLFDFVVSCFSPKVPLEFYRNKGDGTVEKRSKEAGFEKQLGGLNCVQTDFDNDGNLDIFVTRGAWLDSPIRPSLLRNTGGAKFVDVTDKSGIGDPVNSNSSCWADYDNDGFLDVFVCCEKQPNHLYHNKGDGTFEEVAGPAGLLGAGIIFCKGATWIDYDQDNYLDLFMNRRDGYGKLFHNNRNGTFTEVTDSMGIDGPFAGFSCWAWDFDNDGWLDIFATCYEGSLKDTVLGLQGSPHTKHTCKLFRNQKGKRFVDVSKEVGLDCVYETMGSNFGDFDNDGFLDMYLGTGEPNIATLVPNRMFKNVGGKRFVDISGSSGTAHLQKGHGVACGDWDRDGNIDLFVDMGGAIPGDQYHNILFQNPGHDNAWITVKLVGKKTNRPGIGARIKVTTVGPEPQTVHRLVSSGSSFGANPLTQSIGIGKAKRIATLEVHWPTSNTTQLFKDVEINQAIEITEFAPAFQKLNWKPMAVPK